MKNAIATNVARMVSSVKEKKVKCTNKFMTIIASNMNVIVLILIEYKAFSRNLGLLSSCTHDWPGRGVCRDLSLTISNTYLSIWRSLDCITLYILKPVSQSTEQSVTAQAEQETYHVYFERHHQRAARKF